MTSIGNPVRAARLHATHPQTLAAPRKFMPGGVTHGKIVRVPGKGQMSITGNRRGDLHLLINVLPHPLFLSLGPLPVDLVVILRLWELLFSHFGVQ